MASVLEVPKALAEDVATLRSRLAAVQRNYEKLEKQVRAESVDYDDWRQSGLLATAADLRATSYRIGRDLVAVAAKAKEELKARSKRYEIASVVLYVIGWSLGLVGKLFGAE
jgi:hypothetical protein